MVKTLEDFEAMGYGFLQDWTMDSPQTPDRVELPSGRVVDIGEVDAGLRGLVFGDPVQAELYGASEFYGLVREMDVDARTGRYTASFVDDADVEINTALLKDH